MRLYGARLDTIAVYGAGGMVSAPAPAILRSAMFTLYTSTLEWNKSIVKAPEREGGQQCRSRSTAITTATCVLP